MKSILPATFLFVLTFIAEPAAFCQSPDPFTVINSKNGPSITPYLQYQTALMWQYDDARRQTLENIRDAKSLLKLQADTRIKLLNMIGDLPQEKTPLNATVTGRIEMNGFHIEKLIFESMPGFRVTALVYVPDNGAAKHPAVLVACGHSPVGKIWYQALCQRLVQRGYLVICWDPVGQGERSQFWDEAKNQSRYNMVCGEHAVLGNFAYLAGSNLMRWEIWDGIRAVDYLMTRPDVDANRLSITGTSGGGAQAAHMGALDTRIKVVAPSCYISALPMRAYNRIFADPDSDPEQDLFGSVSNGVDHTGLLLLVYPRPLFIASAALDFFPIEGTRKTFREISSVYRRFGKEKNIAMVEGYHKHQFSLPNQEAALNFLDRFNQQPKVEGLPPVKDLPEKDLWCTKKGQVILDFPDNKNLMDIVKSYYLEHQSTNKQTIGYKAGQIKGEVTWEKKGTSQSDGVIIDKYLIHHNEYLQMPLLYFHSASAPGKKTVVWINLNGKASKDQWKEIIDIINKGSSVISFDFRGTGEDKMRYSTVSSDNLEFNNTDSTSMYFNPLSGVFANYVYNSLLTGRPYFLQMIEDTEIAVDFARKQLGIVEVSITGTEESQLLLQQIADKLPNIKFSGNVSNDTLSWSRIVMEKRELWPIQYLMPGGAYTR